MKAPGSGRGWRPLVPSFGPERSRSRLANAAPGRCASRYWLSPSSGLARAWRQSNSRHAPRLRLNSSVETRVEPFMDMDLPGPVPRIVGSPDVPPLLVERARAAVKALADFVVLDRRLDVGRLLRLDDLALEERDLLGIVELHHVGRARGRARDEVRDDEHVRVPLEGEAR